MVAVPAFDTSLALKELVYRECSRTVRAAQRKCLKKNKTKTHTYPTLTKTRF